tara:strand:+ start:4883 stop:7240 length:2358 start_codon:yes stop_codon:yes gene_type:complete
MRTIAQVAAHVREVRLTSESLQRQFQCAPYEGFDDEMEYSVLLLRAEHKKLQVEHDRMGQDAAATLDCKEGKKLAVAIESLTRQVERVVWYEEDALANRLRIEALQHRIEELEARAMRVEETNDRLRRELNTVAEGFMNASDDNLALRNEVAELRDTLKLQEDKSGAAVEFWRKEANKWMLAVSTESIAPRNLCMLLKDGEDSMKPKALRILRAHAKRAPQYVIEQAGALRTLVDVAHDDDDHFVGALNVLLVTTEADHRAHFKSVPNLAEKLHAIVKDDRKRKVALSQLIHMLTFLTQWSGPGVLECKQDRTYFGNMLVVLWREVEPNDGLMQQLAGALAQLTKIDPCLLASPFIVQSLMMYLNRSKVWGGLLVALANMAHVQPVRKLVLQNDALHIALLCLCQTEREGAIRISAARVLKKLCQSPEGMKAVLAANPFPPLFKMMRTDDAEEYEQCMHVITQLLRDDGFCEKVIRCNDFPLAVIERARKSLVALFMLTEMLMRVSTLMEDRKEKNQGKEVAIGQYASRCAYLHHVMNLDAGMMEMVNSHLFTDADPVRRRECMKLVCLFVSCKTDACKVATVFLPGLTAFMRATLTTDQHVLAVAAINQMRRHLPEPFIIEHPGMLKSILRLMAAGLPDAGYLMTQLTAPLEGAFTVGTNWGARMALLNMFAFNKNANVRDRAARSISNIYATGQFDDRRFIQDTKEILKGFVEMWDHRPQVKEERDDPPNGAVRLARYFHNKPKLTRAPTDPAPAPTTTPTNDKCVEINDDDDNVVEVEEVST